MKIKHFNSIILIITTFLFLSLTFIKNVKAAEQNKNNQNNKNDQQEQQATNTIVANAIRDGVSEAKKHIDDKYNEILKKNNEEFKKITENTKNFINESFNNLEIKTNAQFTKLEENIKNTETTINAGIASSISLSSIPYYDNKNISFGIGLGNYKNGNSIGTGIQRKIHDNSNLRVNISWNTKNYIGVGAGLAIGW